MKKLIDNRCEFSRNYNELKVVVEGMDEQFYPCVPLVALRAAKNVSVEKLGAHLLGRGPAMTAFNWRLRSGLMMHGRMDLHDEAKAFLLAVIERGLEPAWHGWLDKQGQDCDANLRYFLNKAKVASAANRPSKQAGVKAAGPAKMALKA